MIHAFQQLALMAAVTLGFVYIPHSVFYDNPRWALGLFA